MEQYWEEEANEESRNTRKEADARLSTARLDRCWVIDGEMRLLLGCGQRDEINFDVGTEDVN